MKKPRLTDSDRLAIETGLRSGKTVYMIAKELSRPVTTITREIRARAVESGKGAAYRVTNRCAFRMECERRQACAHRLHDGRRQCKFCRQCNSHCPAFVEQRCGRLPPPFVCSRICLFRKNMVRLGWGSYAFKQARMGMSTPETDLRRRFSEQLNAHSEQLNATMRLT